MESTLKPGVTIKNEKKNLTSLLVNVPNVKVYMFETHEHYFYLK